MRLDKLSFGSIRIDGVIRDYDVVIDGGEIRKRKKGPSKQFRNEFGNTPLSIEEDIPWNCRRLVVGTGAAWQAAGDERSEARSGALQRRIARGSNAQSH